MSVIVRAPITTTEQLLALEDDGAERMLIRGQLYEEPTTRRNPQHSGAEAEIARLLGNWAKSQPKPRGRVSSGEAGFRLRSDPDSAVGIDVAYISPESSDATPLKAKLVDGIPTLAVEVLSPSDKLEAISAKIEEYLDVGVPHVRIVDSVFRTVTVHRPWHQPELFNIGGGLTAEPHLPGLRILVAEIFEDL